MRSPARLLIAVSVVVLSIGGLWRWKHAAGGAHPPHSVQPAPAPRGDPRDRPASHPDPRQPTATVTGEDAPGGGDPAATGNGSALPSPARRPPVAIPGEWRRRYEHFAPGALEEALVQLERRIAAERGRLFDARFERGEYEVIYPGDPPPIPALPGSDGRLPLEEVRSITDPASAASRAHVARLPLLEHSDFYALLDERDWLAERLGR